MTDANTELTALHNLAESCPGGVDGCAWWNKDLRLSYQYEDTFELEDELGNFVPINDQHALDLVTCEAERWLCTIPGFYIDRGNAGGVPYCHWCFEGKCFTSLPEALTHAMGHA